MWSKDILSFFKNFITNARDAINKILPLFLIFIFIMNFNIAFADNSACSNFFPKLSELPHTKLTQYNNGFKSLWDGKLTHGCEIVFESHESIVSRDKVCDTFQSFINIPGWTIDNNLCGATKKERPLDVDHIKPKSKGGKNVYENLQVLCSKCNRSKGNKDDTDFRDDTTIESDSNCHFCFDNVKSRIVSDYGSAFAIKDKFPVTKGHHLIIPKRHTQDYFSLSENERFDADSLIRILQKRISESDSSVTGFNVGANSGESAGQTIFHAHIHLIPRRDGDTSNPRGGVRGVVPDKMSY